MTLNQDFIMAVQTAQFLNRKKGNDFVQAQKIAEKCDFSLGYLHKVIQTLSRHGIIEAKRGRVGGVRLRNKTVTMLDLWRVTLGGIDAANSSVVPLRKPLKAFSDALSKVVICKKK